MPSINTKTRGVDVVVDGNWRHQKANLVAMLAGNFSQPRLFGKIKTAANLPVDAVNANTLFSRYERGRLENGQPDSKIILSLNYKTSQFGFLFATPVLAKRPFWLLTHLKIAMNISLPK